MSFHFARALSAGRLRRTAPLTRESILAALLRKRAEAARCGLGDLEKQLRSQIRWGLPILTPSSPAEAEAELSLSSPVAGQPEGEVEPDKADRRP